MARAKDVLTAFTEALPPAAAGWVRRAGATLTLLWLEWRDRREAARLGRLVPARA